ncbi:MAG: hypothetical protein Kow0026_25300 [Oricola sp.]
MPRYFLDMRSGDERYVDDVGCCAANECEVLTALIEVLAEYRGEDALPGPSARLRVSIIDTAGQTVARLTV